MTIVRTYADEGKSGLRIDGREALTQLIKDVETGAADFEFVLVYDVSRWGRFQDTDESAYYEYLCKRAGIAVLYCAEQFENDGTPISAVLKNVKRAMAGEFSRELSVKVFAGQSRLIKMGFHLGGVAGYGLRRVLIDESGAVKTTLGSGEEKSIQTDRVVLRPGPKNELKTIRWIFDAYLREGRSQTEIAALLNERRIKAQTGRSWNYTVVHHILTSERYIGNYVWNQVSTKLKKKAKANDRSEWIRAHGVLDPIVEPALFAQAQEVMQKRRELRSDADMLSALRRAYEARGHLCAKQLGQAAGLPAFGAYARRFGSLRQAYKLIDYVSKRDFRYLERQRVIRALHADTVAKVLAGAEQAGGAATFDEVSRLLRINDELTLSILILPCARTRAGQARWRLCFDMEQTPDITLAVRMDETNSGLRDYYVFPRTALSVRKTWLEESNDMTFDSYRCDSLERLFDLTSRTRAEASR